MLAACIGEVRQFQRIPTLQPRRVRRCFLLIRDACAVCTRTLACKRGMTRGEHVEIKRNKTQPLTLLRCGRGCLDWSRGVERDKKCKVILSNKTKASEHYGLANAARES